MKPSSERPPETCASKSLETVKSRPRTKCDTNVAPAESGDERDKKRVETKGEALDDIYCRGCHSRPSYKNINTYLCSHCWNLWNQVRRSAEVLKDSEVDGFKEKLVDFIKSRGRYVWPSEAYLYFRPISMKELKRHKIKIATICRDLRFFAPADDRIVHEIAQRVREFSLNHVKMHNKMPNVREVMAGSGVDHTTLWSCIDYGEFVDRHGGKVDTDIRYRFRDSEEFLRAAAQVVREAGCPLHMTTILEDLGVCYPAYLANFKSVSPDEIHEEAGVSRSPKGVASMLEAMGEKALTELGWEVERQASFPGLVGKGGRPLKFDFRLVGSRFLVEIDGPQHYCPSDTYFKASVKNHDDLKGDYAKRNGYQLIRVDARIHKSPKSMRGFLLPHIGFNQPNLPDARDSSGSACSGINRCETRDYPNPN